MRGQVVLSHLVSSVCLLHCYYEGFDGDWAVVSTTCAISLWLPCTPYSLELVKHMFGYTIGRSVQVKCKHNGVSFLTAYSVRVP